MNTEKRENSSIQENIQIDIRKDALINEFIKQNCSGEGISLKNYMDNFEKEIIIRALNISRGNQRIASFILNINPTTLSEKIKRLDLRKTNKIKDHKDLKQLISEINISLF